MKQRFSSLDIKVIAHELSQTLTSLRVSNIYDLSSRIFLFKFAASSRKEQFVIDSGFRCHLSSYARTAATTPSAFVARLRKFLRTRRVTSVRQVGTDRIIELQFSDGQYHLFLEFYAGGNLVLADQDLKVIALQRNVTEGAAHEYLRAGLQYNLSERQNINGVPSMTRERIREGLQKYVARQATGPQSTNKKPKKKPGDALRKALAGFISEYPPMLLDHSLRVVGFDINLQPENVVQDVELEDKLLTAMEEARKTIEEIMSKATAAGYIFGKPAPSKGDPAKLDQTSSNGSQGRAHTIYDDFHPFKPKHLEEDSSLRILEIEGFNRTVDEFFSSIEGQKLESRLAEREAAAQKKLQHAKLDQEKRLDGLQQVQEMNVRKAQTIEANLERVQEATAAVNGLIAQGMDWDEVGKLVELEQKRKNPVAEVIKLPLKLNENTVTLKLAEWDVDEGDEETNDTTDSGPSDSEAEGEQNRESRKSTKANEVKADDRLLVDVDLGLSAWSNAREYYDQKRTAAVKQDRTLQASAKALKSTQRKVEADLKRALKQEKQVLRPVRKAFWFEKFTYFLSSDGYLVLSARDAQQCDILYRKHLKKGDVWVHADLEGAMPCVIKNREASEDAPVPPSTLSQAGNLSVSTSTAWNSKAVMSAWWVRKDQVTKRVRTGDYLEPGRFEVNGDKNYLPPAQLLLGFAVLFHISEQSKARHMKHRIREDAPTASSPTSKAEAIQDDKSVVVESDAAIPIGGDHIATNIAYDEHNGAGDSAISDGSDSEEPSAELNDAEETAVRHANPLQPSFLDASAGNSGDREANSSEKIGESMDKSGSAIDAPHSEDESSKESFQADENASVPAAEDAVTDSNEDAISESNTYEDRQSITETLVGSKAKGPIPVRGKKGKKKKIAQKYAGQDEEDRAEAMRLLGSAAGQQKQKEETEAKAERDKQAAAQRQRRREQHQRALERKAQQEERVDEADEDEEEDEISVDLDTLVGTPLPGDDILEAVPICAPWGALGRYKYKVKLQPGNDKKGKAVRSILGKWGADAANKRNVDEKAEDAERIWPREIELIKSWKEAEVFGIVPVSKVRLMMSGVSSAGGANKGPSKQKQKKPSGKGSKKQR